MLKTLLVGRCLPAATIGLLLVAGCDRGEVTSYDIPKEPATGQTPAPQGPGSDPHTGMGMGWPSVKWGELPTGWTQSPQTSGMRLATFTLAAPQDQSAEMAIIPMVGFAGTDQQLVNMWRSQLGLPELEATGGTPPERVQIGGVEGQLYEMSGTVNEVATRIIVAAANRDGVNFFFKLIGHDAVVTGQKDAFLNFLKGVEFTAPEPAGAPAPVSMPPMAATAPSDGKRWEAPSNWEERPATQFLLAKYRVAGEDGASAEVTVSMLGGSAGGLLPNVNRWRGQLNLGPVDEAGLAALLQDVKAGSVEAKLVQLEGTDLKSGVPARMLTVIVTLPTETWFFKMTGPVPVVQAKTDEFLAFVKAARF
jgi:hypothetical protein